MPGILLVDDHVMFREGIALTIARAQPGAVIHAASTGKAAMAALGERPDIGVVMMDFYLPDIAGSVLLRYLWQLRQLRRHLRILVVTASEDPVDVRRALTAARTATCTRPPTATPCSTRWRGSAQGRTTYPKLSRWPAPVPCGPTTRRCSAR